MSDSMSSAFGGLLRRANDALAGLMGDQHLLIGKNGEIIYSKNNVCVHDDDCSRSTPVASAQSTDDDIVHTPGYLTVRCQSDAEFGVTLVLQWLPNATLQRNPASIRCISPHRIKCDSVDDDNRNTVAVDSRRAIVNTIPEQFAKAHNLIMDSAPTTHRAGAKDVGPQNGAGSSHADSMGPELPPARPLFSVNLGKMRSMRIFYSNAERSSGQLVIASADSHYKILHFHHGGLDRLAGLFGDWNAIKAKSVNEGSPSPGSDHQLLIFRPEVAHDELDPEDGLYRRVDAEFWRSYCNADGSVDDPFTIRKAIYFASMDAELRPAIWPFLLGVHSWRATSAQRAAAAGRRLAAYRTLADERLRQFDGVRITVANAMAHNHRHATVAVVDGHLRGVANTIAKDVVRTDRRNPFFAGDENANLETMNCILLNYAAAEPSVGYVQGMSDLVGPLLSTLRDESLTYACFANLMPQTLFVGPTQMDVNLAYLRELIRLLAANFHAYLAEIGGDAPQLMFVHRWILLFFKREFPEDDALHIWEACWAKYRTSYFHLFVCTAIVIIYGADIIAQRLPHDEILLYFSSLTMHMEADIILKKARGLLHQFYRLRRLPCTLGGLCEHSDATNEQWSSHSKPHAFDCVQSHDDGICPYANP